VALGQGQIFHISVEVGAASGAMVLGVGNLDIPWPTGNGIAQVVQVANDNADAICTPSTFWTPPMPIAATALTDLGLRQVLNTRNPLGHIGNVPSWPGHGDILHQSPSPELSAKPAANQEEYSVMMLQSPI
jgi:hypothetical protein